MGDGHRQVAERGLDQGVQQGARLGDVGAGQGKIRRSWIGQRLSSALPCQRGSMPPRGAAGAYATW
ncbi:hypothetical protein [Phytohabitans rumicis]|uniref:hypothetical protein n=1 Tax=Phytohabitans rumicis TaxID=1076125 RepID=UPI001FE766A0|nr:hypothetical protein [Phytohabitans rumicis]